MLSKPLLPSPLLQTLRSKPHKLDGGAATCGQNRHVSRVKHTPQARSGLGPPAAKSPAAPSDSNVGRGEATAGPRCYEAVEPRPPLAAVSNAVQARPIVSTMGLLVLIQVRFLSLGAGGRLRLSLHNLSELARGQ
jgi:hypothetical protein